jgi:3-phenylpropionate/trans-cinnamate dioxygenase ferredoxin component
MPFVEVAAVGDVPQGTMQSFSVGIWQVLVAHVDDRFFAMDNACSHAAAGLAQGTLKGATVTCPEHGARFDVTTGKCLAGPKGGLFREKGRDVRAFAVKVEAGKIMVDSG